MVRGPKREIISRSYNLLLRTTLGAGFSDAQCGFKAIRADQARQLLPLVEDRGWFFDTELLVLAERAGLRIHEVPVDWIDDADSRVNIVDTALGDLRGMTRVGLGLARGTIKVPQLRETGLGPSRGLAWQVPRFAVIGVASTLAYIVVFLALRGFMGAQAANALSLLLTAVFNTAANRRLTFGVTGRAGAAVHHFRGLIAFGVCLVLTSGALMALHAVSASPGRGTEIAVLVAANLVATALRFVLYRGWVFARTPGDASRPAGPRRPRPVNPLEMRDERHHRHVEPAHRSSPPPGTAAPPGARPGGRSAVGQARAVRPARPHRAAVPVGPQQERLRQRLLRRRGAGGDEVVEGRLLRLLRLVQLHHRGQDPGVAVGGRAVGEDIRVQLVVAARAAGG